MQGRGKLGTKFGMDQMKTISKKFLTAAAIFSLALNAAPAFALASSSGQFNVTATVLSACSVSSTDLVFGNYSASAASPTYVSNTVSITCTNNLPYTVALDGGQTAGNVAARTLTDGASHYLKYFLYTASNHATLWGDGTSGTSTVGGTGTGSGQTLSVYGAIPAAQYVNAGSYTDKVTVTVNY